MHYETGRAQPVPTLTPAEGCGRELPERPGPRWRRPWVQVLGVGLVLWVASTLVTVLTENSNLLPTVILLGSFLVPVTFVIWAWERRTHLLTTDLLFRCFVVGGVLGVLGASVLESYLLRPSWLVYLEVGFIEEFVKLAALIWCTRKLAVRTLRDGAILGATVGFGFAAFESAGYSFNAFFTPSGLSLQRLVETEVLRSFLAPFGHGLWTAIIGAVLFAAAPRGRLRITGRVVTGFVAVALLHGLWDSMNGIAIVLTVLLTGQQWQIRTLESGRVPQISPEQADVFTLLSDGGLAVVTLLGLLLLQYVLRSDRLHPPEALTPRAVHRAGGYRAPL
jgi:RsiW-degrading membrane proteinase PrsW (M82 family)